MGYVNPGSEVTVGVIRGACRSAVGKRARLLLGSLLSKFAMEAVMSQQATRSINNDKLQAPGPGNDSVNVGAILSDIGESAPRLRLVLGKCW